MRHLLDPVSRLAIQAGQAIEAVRRAGKLDVAHKSHDDPVTAADHAAHDILAAGLPAIQDLPLLSEEGGIPSLAERRTWDRYWLVDPLDGTKEFIKGTGEFTVNVAIIEDGEPVLGVVHLPATGVTYAGVPGEGAWCEDAPIRVTPPHSPLRVVASRSHRNKATEEYLAALPAHRLVPAGSSLKFCRIAEGAADVYPRLGPTMEWDTAAGHAVLVAAGGRVHDLEGRPLRYNKEDLHNPFFVARGATDVSPGP